MKDPHFEYDRLVQEALKGVMKDVLAEVSAQGLPGEHHFYITFRTGEDGVRLPNHLAAKYPDEMTIVLQHRFHGLEVFDDHFKVGLSFNQKPELLVIPFDEVTSFVDPAAQFALQFGSEDEDEIEAEPMTPQLFDEQMLASQQKHPARPRNGAESADTETARARAAGENVVPLDAFRKKS